MTVHFNYHHHWCSGDNQSIRSSVPVVSRWLWPGNRTLLKVASMVVTWWLVDFCTVEGSVCIMCLKLMEGTMDRWNAMLKQCYKQMNALTYECNSVLRAEHAKNREKCYCGGTCMCRRLERDPLMTDILHLQFLISWFQMDTILFC